MKVTRLLDDPARGTLTGWIHGAPAELAAATPEALRTGHFLDSFVFTPALNAALRLPPTAPTGWLVTVPARTVTKALERTPAPMRQTSPAQPAPDGTSWTRAIITRQMKIHAERHRRPDETGDQAYRRLLNEGDERMNQLYAWYDRTSAR